MRKILPFLMCAIILFGCVGCANGFEDTTSNTQNTTQDITDNDNTSNIIISVEGEEIDNDIESSDENNQQNQNTNIMSENNVATNDIGEAENVENTSSTLNTESAESTEDNKNDNTDVKGTDNIIIKEDEQETLSSSVSSEITEKKENVITNTEPKPTISQKITLSEMEKEIFNCVNEERAKVGLPAYEFNYDIYELALIRANEASYNWDLAHTRPDGRKYSSVFYDYNKQYTYKCANENLGRRFSSAQQIVEAFMNSVSHAANIVNEKYTKISIAVITGDDGLLYVCQLFTG